MPKIQKDFSISEMIMAKSKNKILSDKTLKKIDNYLSAKDISELKSIVLSAKIALPNIKNPFARSQFENIINKYSLHNEDFVLLKHEFEQNQAMLPLTGGGIYSNQWIGVDGDKAMSQLKLYIQARHDSAAKKWLKNPPTTLKLSQQAIHNWRHSKPGHPFSGMIDTRNNEIYLVPATRRSETVGVKGQIAWSASDLKYQWFHRTKHLGYKQADPMMMFQGALKMRNIDHGNAAYYLEGKQISRSEIQDEIDLFASWLELQYISMNWLGFFAYRDQTSGKMNLNFKSAQLNFPNLNIHEYSLGNIFILDGKNKIDFSIIYNDSDLEQLKNKATNLPDKIKELVIKEMQKLN